MRVVVVGGGIIGLAVARELARQRPADPVTVIEKEAQVAAHQTGHNSGVVHAGIYYPPGSLKAELCRRGGMLLREFASEHGIALDEVGKLVVALEEAELGRLTEIERRAQANGVTAVRVDAIRMREIEPHLNGLAAIHSPTTAMIDYGQVSRAVAADLAAQGGEVRLATELIGVRRGGGRTTLLTNRGELTADHVVVCAGLQSSQVARLFGDEPEPRIIPFRGEYYRLSPSSAALVRGMIYPVPDPRYPFLGIHLTRRIDGTVDVGPNAVLALALQGYRRRDINLRDLREIAGPGLWALARAHWRTGAREVLGSLSRRFYLAQARRYVPALTAADLEPAPAGVRAQAVDRAGRLVDDFVINRRAGVTLVRNAPSPGATSSFAIAEHIVAQMSAG